MVTNHQDNFSFHALGKVIRFQRFSLIIVFFLGSLLTGYYIKTSDIKYSATTTIEIKDDRGDSGFSIPRILENSAVSLMMPSLPSAASKGSSSLVPRILGNEFLSKIIKNRIVEEDINKLCRYSRPNSFSLEGALQSLGFYEYLEPNSIQIDSKKIACIASMISISKFKYKGIQTNAFTITVKSGLPSFSANLANTIVDTLFEEYILESRERFEKEMQFLTEKLVTEQVKHEKINTKLEAFLIENSNLFSSFEPGNSSVLSLTFDRAFLLKLNESEKLKKMISASGLALKVLEKINQKEKFALEDYNEALPILSNEISLFLVKTNLDDKKMLDELSKSSRLSAEIDRIEEAVAKYKLRLKKKSVQIEDWYSKQNEWKALKFEFVKSRAYMENFASQLKEKTMSAEGLDLKENYRYARAHSPTEPSDPNVRFFLVVGVIFSLFSAILFAIIKQALSNKIYDATQLQEVSGLENIISLKEESFSFKKKLQPSRISDFFKTSIINGLLLKSDNILIVSLGKDRAVNALISEKILIYFSMFMNFNQKKTLCVLNSDAQLSKFGAFGDHNNGVFQEFKSSSNTLSASKIYVTSVDRLSKNELFNEDEIQNTFEKVLISENRQSDGLSKFETKESLKVVFVAKIGKFRVVDVEESMNFLEGDKNKCLGFIFLY